MDENLSDGAAFLADVAPVEDAAGRDLQCSLVIKGGQILSWTIGTTYDFLEAGNMEHQVMQQEFKTNKKLKR